MRRVRDGASVAAALYQGGGDEQNQRVAITDESAAGSEPARCHQIEVKRMDVGKIEQLTTHAVNSNVSGIAPQPWIHVSNQNAAAAVLENERANAAEAALSKWRVWARFVFSVNVEGSDDDVRARICEAYDRDVAGQGRSFVVSEQATEAASKVDAVDPVSRSTDV